MTRPSISVGVHTPQPAEKSPIGYTPETVLTIEQLADWLQVSKRAAERLHIPAIYLGTRTRRFLAADVLAYLKSKAA